MRKIIVIILILFSKLYALAQNGMLDQGFGNRGYVLTTAKTSGNIRNENVQKIFSGADGKMLLLITADDFTFVSRRLPTGEIDSGYATNGFSEAVRGYGVSAALQKDGKIVFVCNSNGPNTNFLIARVNTDGHFDLSFGQGGIVSADAGADNDLATSMTMDPDGKIITAGRTSRAGVNEFVVFRHNNDGTRDGGFGENGMVTTSFEGGSSISSISIQSDGKILAVGTAFDINSGDYAIARYNADGSPDLTFDQDGKLTSDFGFSENAVSATIQPNDGKILIGGYGSDASGFYHFRIARYNPDGTLDLSYNGNGSSIPSFGNSNDFLQSLAIQPDGKLVTAGYSNQGSLSILAFARLNTDGSPDVSFGTGGTVLANISNNYDQNSCVSIQPDGKIIAGGQSMFNFNYDFTITRLDINGIPDPLFGTAGIFSGFVPSSNLIYQSPFILSNGKLILSGNSYDGTNNVNFLQRLNGDGSPDNDYGLNSFAVTRGNYAAAMADGSILEAGSSFGNNADIALYRYKPDGSPDSSFGVNGMMVTDFGADEYPGLIAIQSDNKIIVGGYTFSNSGTDWIIIRYNADGSPDNSFGNGGKVITDFEDADYPQGIAFAAGNKIMIVGLANHFPDPTSVVFDVLMARYNADGSLDASFGTNGKKIVDYGNLDALGSVAIQQDGKTLLGAITGDFDRFSSYVIRYDQTGQPDSTFAVNGILHTEGTSVVLEADQKILVAGDIINDQANLDSYLARFNTDGSPDNIFGTGGRTITSFTPGDDIALAPALSGNQLFVSGFSDYKDLIGLVAKFDLGNPSAGITCPENKVVPTDSGMCAAKILSIDPVVTPAGADIMYKMSGATKGSGPGSASGQLFDKGITVLTYVLANDTSKSCSLTVTVQDKEAPVISNLIANPNQLWPPDQQLKDVALSYSVTDNCESDNTSISISSNELVLSGENGDKAPDWIIIDKHHIKLRAERLRSGDGRVYTIKVSSTDAAGNTSEKTTSVSVPKNEGHAECDLSIGAMPNPSHGSFLLTLKSNCITDKIRLVLTNEKGGTLQVIDNIYPGQTVRIGSSLSPGIYFVQAKQGGRTNTTKIIKL